MTSPLGIDLPTLDAAVDRLSTALELVTTIRDAAGLLEDLVNDPNDPVAPALEAAARMNGNGASPPQAPAELTAGAGHPPRPAPSSSSTLHPPAPATQRSRDDSGPAPAPRRQASPNAVDAILDYFEAHPRESFATADLMAALGIPRSTISRAVLQLVETSTLERLGTGAQTKHRLDPGLAEELERPDAEPETDEERAAMDRALKVELEDRDVEEAAAGYGDEDLEAIKRAQDAGKFPVDEVPNPIDPAADGDDDEQDDDDVEVYREPDRAAVSRELERTAGLAPPRRSRPSGTRITVSAGGELEAALKRRLELCTRIKRSLGEEAKTISELELALDVPRRELAPLVLELVEDEAEPIVKCGLRGPRYNETVYGNNE